MTMAEKGSPSHGGEFLRDLKKAWSPHPIRFCQHQVGCVCVLARDSQMWDLARDASELEVGETRQRPCLDQGGKTEGTQALGALVVVLPTPTMS